MYKNVYEFHFVTVITKHLFELKKLNISFCDNFYYEYEQ